MLHKLMVPPSLVLVYVVDHVSWIRGFGHFPYAPQQPFATVHLFHQLQTWLAVRARLRHYILAGSMRVTR